jgi:hypothetical protein
MMWHPWGSRDGGIKQKIDLYGLSFGWGQWLFYKDRMPLKKKRRRRRRRRKRKRRRRGRRSLCVKYLLYAPLLVYFHCHYCGVTFRVFHGLPRAYATLYIPSLYFCNTKRLCYPIVLQSFFIPYSRRSAPAAVGVLCSLLLLINTRNTLFITAVTRARYTP